MTPTSWYYDHDVDVMGIWDLGTMTLKNLGLKGLNPITRVKKIFIKNTVVVAVATNSF